MSPELEVLIAKAKEWMENANPEEKKVMFEAQAKAYARSVANWPKPKFKWIDGIKVYDSYEDYVND